MTYGNKSFDKQKENVFSKGMMKFIQKNYVGKYFEPITPSGNRSLNVQNLNEI
jgi:hypothetical protein